MQKYNEMQQQLAASRASNGKYNGDNGGFGADTIFEEDESVSSAVTHKEKQFKFKI